MPTNTNDGEAAVPDAAARRLSNQVARVHNNTYGAEIGFCTLVGLASVQMLRAGVSREAVTRALSDVVRDSPGAVGADPSIGIHRRDRVSVMLALTAARVSDVADRMAIQFDKRVRAAKPRVASAND